MGGVCNAATEALIHEKGSGRMENFVAAQQTMSHQSLSFLVETANRDGYPDVFLTGSHDSTKVPNGSQLLVTGCQDSSVEYIVQFFDQTRRVKRHHVCNVRSVPLQFAAFCSHSKTRDYTFSSVRDVQSYLEAYGYNVFVDIDILVDITKVELARFIASSSIFLLFLDDVTLRSDWCSYEVLFAAQCNIPIHVVINVDRHRVEELIDQMRHDDAGIARHLFGSGSKQVICYSLKLGVQHQKALSDVKLRIDSVRTPQNVTLAEDVAFPAKMLYEIASVKFRRGDYAGAQTTYKEALRIHEAMDTARTFESAQLVMGIGACTERLGDAAGGLDCHMKALNILQEVGKFQSEDGSNLMVAIGVAQRSLGNDIGALQSFESAREIREETQGLQSVEGANLMVLIGSAKQKLGDTSDAFRSFVLAKEIREATGTLQTSEGAGLLDLIKGIELYKIGLSKFRRGDYAGAQKTYEEALQIHAAMDAAPTFEGAQLLTGIGACAERLGDAARGLDYHMEAMNILRAVGKLQSEEGSDLMVAIGVAQRSLGNDIGALQSFESAREIREETQALQSVEGANLMVLIGSAKQTLGDNSNAFQSFVLAKEIREATGTLQTPEGTCLLDLIKGVESEVAFI